MIEQCLYLYLCLYLYRYWYWCCSALFTVWLTSLSNNVSICVCICICIYICVCICICIVLYCIVLYCICRKLHWEELHHTALLCLRFVLLCHSQISKCVCWDLRHSQQNTVTSVSGAKNAVTWGRWVRTEVKLKKSKQHFKKGIQSRNCIWAW